MQCEYVFNLQPSMYSTDPARIAYITNLTTGRARRWINASLEGSAAYMHIYKDFVLEFKAVFDHDVPGQDADTALSALQQGSSSVADYATEFRILAARCEWNKPALRSAFVQGLSEPMRDALAERERPPTLTELISLSISIDERRRARRRERASQHHAAVKQSPSVPTSLTRSEQVPSASSSPTCEEDAMQLGRIRLTSRGRLSPTERERRRLHGLCTYCASSTHSIGSCPILLSKVSTPRSPGGAVSSTRGFRVSCLTTTSQPRTSVALFPVTLAWQGQTRTVPALIDSGADESFIDLQYARKVGLPVSPLKRPLPASALNGHPLGPITHRAHPITLTVSGNHVERICPYIIHSPGTPFILGRPWLELHTPHVCWSSGRILRWSAACQVCCLQPAPSSVQPECPPARLPPRRRCRRRRRARPDVLCQSPGGDSWRGGPVTSHPPSTSHMCAVGVLGASAPPEGSRTLHSTPHHTCLPVMTTSPPAHRLQSPDEAIRARPVCSSVPVLLQSMVGKVRQPDLGPLCLELDSLTSHRYCALFSALWTCH